MVFTFQTLKASILSLLARLHCERHGFPQLYFEPLKLLIFYLMRFRIKLLTLLGIQIQLPNKLRVRIQRPVEEQIDETDKRKIPQIVWAESGSLIVPV